MFLEEQGANYPLCTLKLSCGICRVTGGNIKYAVDGANLARKEAKRRGSLRAFPYSDAMQHLKLGMEQGIPPLSVSIGISRCPDDGKQFADLFNATDRVMYEAKRKGKDSFCFFRPDLDTREER